MKPSTTLLQDARGIPKGFSSLSTAVHRASTVLFEDAESFIARGKRRYRGYSYGLYGTPTSATLARQLAVLENARHVVLAPSGLAAINLVNFAALRAGDHALLSDAMYGPTRTAAVKLFGPLGVETEFYDPLYGAMIAARIRKNTRLVWLESPGTITMEVQDVRAIAKAVRARRVLLAMDNTWATPLRFRPLEHGVDFSIQALTKYVGGHSDLLLGSVAVRDETLFRRLRDAQGLLGIGASPDDCFLALRGLGTLAVRMERQFAGALRIARWLATRNEVQRVLHPALETDPGHAIWKRDLSGAGSVFSIVLRNVSWAAARAFTDRLRLFRIGASWGGIHSLVSVYEAPPERCFPKADAIAPIVRLSVGLEDPDDLIADLERGLIATRKIGKTTRRK